MSIWKGLRLVPRQSNLIRQLTICGVRLLRYDYVDSLALAASLMYSLL